MKKHEDFCSDYIKFCDWKFEGIDELEKNAVQNLEQNVAQNASQSTSQNTAENNKTENIKENQVIQNINEIGAPKVPTNENKEIQ